MWQGKSVAYNLRDCAQIIPTELILYGNKEFREAVRDGQSLCLDPAKSSTSVFNNGDSKAIEESREISIEWISCEDDVPEQTADITCIPKN